MKRCVFMSAIFLTFKNASNRSQQYVLHSQAKIPTTYMKNLRLTERRRKNDCDHPLASPCVVIMATSGVRAWGMLLEELLLEEMLQCGHGCIFVACIACSCGH